MPWFRVDDTMSYNAKIVAAGNAAVGLWARAGAWAMQQLSDGFVPTQVARSMGTQAEIRRLLQVRLWVEADGGYRFHEWAERQPSRERLEADRHAARERQQRAREAAQSRRESRRDTGVSHGPPKPIPSQPVLPTEVLTAAVDESPAAAPPKRKRRLPDDFEPNDTNRRVAAEHHVNLDRVVPQFRDYHLANGSAFVDWHKALDTWVRREKPDPQPTNGVRHIPHASELERPPDGLSPSEYAAWERERRARRGA